MTSLLACVVIVASFVLFTNDQLAGASTHQQNLLADTAASPKARTVEHAQPRRFIDGADRALTSPFRSLVHSRNDWVNEGVPTVLALLFYGPGLGMVARISRPSP